jgi:ribosomal protein S18 acetylase RimI-like enzyme
MRASASTMRPAENKGMGLRMANGEVMARRLRTEDLDRVVAIDAELTGGSRRGYFEKRLAAALREPDHHLQFGIEGADGLAAYALARVLSGEFGQNEESVLLETIGVAPGAAGRGFGTQLLQALEDEMRRCGIAKLATSIDWTDHNLARFFARHGFVKAPRHIIACPVSQADLL